MQTTPDFQNPPTYAPYTLTQQSLLMNHFLLTMKHQKKYETDYQLTKKHA